MDDHPAAANATFSSLLPLSERPIEGEGVHFGFPASQQYDGYSYADDTTSIGHDPDHGLYHSSTPPPTVEAAQSDPDVTELASLDARDAERAIDSMGITFDNREDIVGMSRGGLTLLNGADNELPPPPPPLDDPSDPPPAIDIDFQTSVNTSGIDLGSGTSMRPLTDVRLMHQHSNNNLVHSDTHASARDSLEGPPSSITLPASARIDQPTTPAPPGLGQDASLAPPPYLNPVAFEASHSHVDVEHATRPPPYVDFVSSDER
jgi:hypothetical protein